MNKPVFRTHATTTLRSSMGALAMGSLSAGLALALSACGVDNVPASTNLPGSDSLVVGNVNGQDLVVHEAIAFRVDGPEEHGVAVVLTNRAGACAALENGAALATATTLTLFVPDSSANAPRASVRSIDWPATGAPAKVSLATFSTNDAVCATTPDDSIEASRGRVELDRVALSPGQRSVGSFDLGFGTDALVGKFAAVYCNVVEPSSDPFAAAKACQ